MELAEEDTNKEIRFLESINLRLAGEITFLRQMLESQQEIIQQLVAKVIGAPRNLSQFTTTEDLEPISGYQSLDSKIREAEAKAKEEYDKSQKAQNKEQ